MTTWGSSAAMIESDSISDDMAERFRHKRPILCLLLVLTLLAWGKDVPAQSSTDQTHKDWKVVCPKPEDSDQESCFMVQKYVLTQENPKQNRELLRVEVGYVPEQPQAVVVITVPLGVSLPPGVLVQVDEGKTTRVEVEHCMPEGCRVYLGLDNTLLSSLKAGNQLVVTFHDPARRPVAIRASLLGFTAAFNAIKPKSKSKSGG